LSRDGPFVRLVSDVRGNGAGAVPAGERFVELRPLLFSIAYRMLGSVAEAEDVVQDGFLRWHYGGCGGRLCEELSATRCHRQPPGLRR
jgi:hypothetical protein